ncbi:MAG: hypothetical protein RL722_824 [Pseudomonadota bacterium]|jgi:hypothetical protein
MTDPKEPTDPTKDNASFFRKVVRFVANPTTDWADLNNAQREAQENDYARSELKAMIERKRRNDFVRKREFDMLRKIRREGLTGDGLAGLEGLSHLDDSEVRNPDGARPDVGVKEKIDAIEQQMVGEGMTGGRRSGAVVRASGSAMSDAGYFGTSSSAYSDSTPVSPDAFKPTAPLDMSNSELGMTGSSSTLSPSSTSRPRVSVLSKFSAAGDVSDYIIEVTELAHDPELDEAVIAFANADYELCERSLRSLVSTGGTRAQHSDTWFALFDLYRAVGQQSKFEALAMDYAQRFGWSAPQWFSLPKTVADAAASHKPRRGGSSSTQRRDSAAGWVAPTHMDVESITQLRGQLLQMPLPWVLDWRPAQRLEVEAATALTRLLQDWADEAVEMRWLGGEQFIALLADLAPTGAKDADPAYWLLRLEVMRLANQPVEFDQAAIDYCLTYEVSPPSWEPARCSLRITGSTGVTVAPSLGVEANQFAESEIEDDGGDASAHALTLSGQLVGDISPTLKLLENQLGDRQIVKVSCDLLVRMDFIAAGDLLNWVLARRGEDRSVVFENAHRLVALFCGAMGINEHARVTVRNL